MPVQFCTQRDQMKRLAVAKICGYLLFGAISISANHVVGQSYRSAPGMQSNQVRRPLNQLPPIVSSTQAQKSPTPQPSKELYVPPSTKNLPPIVTPGKTNGPGTPPIVQSKQLRPQNGILPSLPNRTAVPIIQSSSPTPTTSGFPTLNPIPTPTNSAPPIVQGSGTRSPMPVQQGSGARSLPPIVEPTESKATPLPRQDFANSLAPGDIPALPEIEIDEPNTVIESSEETLSTTSDTSQITDSTVPSNGLPGTNNFFDSSVPGAPVSSGCASCGNSNCYDPNTVQAQNGCCGSVANAGYYLFAEAIFWTRADGEVQLSNFFGLSDFNFVGGGRFTLGFRDNATEGRELTYFGTGDLDEAETVNNAAGALQPLFDIDPSLTIPTGFINAVTHTQTKETQLHSLEYNRIRWGWDLLKTFIGLRYIYFDDSYSFFGTNLAGTNALFTMDSVNNLFGAHTGFELFYDVGYRTSASFTGKFGGYVNSANYDTNLFNFGTQILNQEEDDASIASTMEFNFMSHFQVSPRSRFRLGYDIFLGWGLFTVQNNIPRDTFARGFSTGDVDLSPFTGTNLNTNNEPVFFHGPSVGFEIFR